MSLTLIIFPGVGHLGCQQIFALGKESSFPFYWLRLRLSGPRASAFSFFCLFSYVFTLFFLVHFQLECTYEAGNHSGPVTVHCFRFWAPLASRGSPSKGSVQLEFTSPRFTCQYYFGSSFSRQKHRHGGLVAKASAS